MVETWKRRDGKHWCLFDTVVSARVNIFPLRLFFLCIPDKIAATTAGCFEFVGLLTNMFGFFLSNSFA
jgi:hypothetical protein